MVKAYLYQIKRNGILFFFTKAILFLIVVIIMDFLVGNALSYYYFKQVSGLQYRSTYSIEKTTADMLVFGSSRANHHYKPEVIEKELNVSYYNLGRDGSSILYHYAVLNAVTKRYIPKMIILDINESEFRKSEVTYERLSSLLPYYKTHPEMRPIIELRSKYENYKLYSSVYPYNSFVSTIILGNTELNKNRKADYLGYIPLYKKWDEAIKTNQNSAAYEIDRVKVKTFESFVAKCVQSNIRLYVVFSPFFNIFTHPDYSVELAKQISEQYNVQFIDYTNDTTFVNDNDLFADFGHLNDKGAHLFTIELTKKIRESFRTKHGN